MPESESVRVRFSKPLVESTFPWPTLDLRYCTPVYLEEMVWPSSPIASEPALLHFDSSSCNWAPPRPASSCIRSFASCSFVYMCCTWTSRCIRSTGRYHLQGVLTSHPKTRHRWPVILYFVWQLSTGTESWKGEQAHINEKPTMINCLPLLNQKSRPKAPVDR